MAAPVGAAAARAALSDRRVRKGLVWFVVAVLVTIFALFPISVVLGLGPVAGAAAEEQDQRGGGGEDGESCYEDAPGDIELSTGPLDNKQIRNARVIVGVGQDFNMSHRGMRIALATALTESNLRNLGREVSDRDSHGIFQQRPSTGWGDEDELLDPVYASRAFYGGPQGPNDGEPPGLLDIPNWEDMPLAEAAQAVQRSAYPDRYADFEEDARTLLVSLLGPMATDDLCTPGGGDDVINCQPTDHDAEDGLNRGALQTLRCIAQNFPDVTNFVGVYEGSVVGSDHPDGNAVDAMIPDYTTARGVQLGDDVADWVIANQACLGVKYLIWNERQWWPTSGWRGYTHRDVDDNTPSRDRDRLQHKDHVHVSLEETGGNCLDGSWVTPIQGSYQITANFGDSGSNWTNRHTGIDLGGTGYGRPVLAAAGGKVTYTGFDGAYGNKVVVTHPGGHETWYAHLTKWLVEEGTSVSVGQPIGEVGSTGNSTGPHLHFEVRPSGGDPVDPKPWMEERGAPFQPTPEPCEGRGPC